MLPACWRASDLLNASVRKLAAAYAMQDRCQSGLPLSMQVCMCCPKTARSSAARCGECIAIIVLSLLAVGRCGLVGYIDSAILNILKHSL